MTGNWCDERKPRIKEAFEELVRRHQHRVLAVAGGILRRREDVEDIAQQVFCEGVFFAETIRSAGGIQHVAVQDHRERVLGPVAEEKSAAAVVRIGFERRASAAVRRAGRKSTPAPDISDTLEAQQRVERLLAGLDERDRMMLILKEVEGFAIEEIAEMLGPECEHREGPIVSGA